MLTQMTPCNQNEVIKRIIESAVYQTATTFKEDQKILGHSFQRALYQT